LVSLPRDPTVSRILEQFKEDYNKNHSSGMSSRRGQREPKAEDIINEIVEGLKLYFDRALGTILLYKFERQQYLDWVKENPDVRLSDVYGAEHLLRLFGIDIYVFFLKK